MMKMQWKQMGFCSGRRWRENRGRLLSTSAVLLLLLLLLFLLAFTPRRIPPSPRRHQFADKRNLLRIPNTLNVITSFPFLVIGVVGFVFSLHGGSCLGISLKGEVWSWAVYYGGLVALAFGSAYYHLKPDDDRAVWDRLPIMISTIALFSALVIERIDGQLGVAGLFSLLPLALISILFERTFGDLRLTMVLYYFPWLAILAILLLFHPKYNHSRIWFLVAGLYVLARIGDNSDSKVYRVNQYIISGHSLEHLSLAVVSFMLTVMLWLRNIKIDRDS